MILQPWRRLKATKPPSNESGIGRPHPRAAAVGKVGGSILPSSDRTGTVAVSVDPGAGVRSRTSSAGVRDAMRRSRRSASSSTAPDSAPPGFVSEVFLGESACLTAPGGVRRQPSLSGSRERGLIRFVAGSAGRSSASRLRYFFAAGFVLSCFGFMPFLSFFCELLPLPMLCSLTFEPASRPPAGLPAHVIGIIGVGA